jgi:hypothetical protein
MFSVMAIIDSIESHTLTFSDFSFCEFFFSTFEEGPASLSNVNSVLAVSATSALRFL